MAVAAPGPLVGLASQFEDASFGEVAGVFSQLRALECAVRSGQMALLRVACMQQGWADDGASSLVDWVAQQSGITIGEARELVEVASALETLPFLAAAFGQGRISWRRLCLLVKIANAETDEHFGETSACYSLAQLQALARAKVEVVEADVVDAFESRSLSFSTRGQEAFIRGRLPVDFAAVVLKAVERIADQAGVDPVTGLYPDRRQSQADALVELAGARIGADSGPDRATVVVEVDLASLAGNGVGALGEFSIPSETIRRLCCDGRLQIHTFNNGEAVGVGRTTRTIPPWLARMLRKRDRGCRFPGCWRTRWSDGHHIQHWQHGGPTNLTNLITLCKVHHHFVHERHWKIVGDPNHLVEFTTPDGKSLKSNGPALQAKTWNTFSLMLDFEGHAPWAVPERHSVPSPDG